MNPLVLTCLLCFVVCSSLGIQGSDATSSSELAGVTGGPASGEGLQSMLSDDDGMETDQVLSGGDSEHFSLQDSHPGRDERKKRKGRGRKKNKQRSKLTTPLNPEHAFLTSGYTSTFSTMEDPCTSTYLGYCIHGFCQHIEGLQEPVCKCMRGYEGDRCGIKILGSVKTQTDPTSSTAVVQTVLVIIAVVLSVISCIAILLMTCAHYRSHKNFLASYLGTGTEQEKLQKPAGDGVV